jgi:hypothetical protein
VTVISTDVHALAQLLADAAAGRFPPADGAVEVVAPGGGDHAVVEFTGHAVVLTDRDPDAVSERGADGFGGASHPDLLRWLAGPGGWIGTHDAVLVAPGTGGGRLPATDRHDDHPRVVRARAHRHDVRVHADDEGLVTLGRGLVGRLELSVELLSAAPDRSGVGRRLIRDGLALAPPGELVWAQVAPGNAASLRAFLSCGFVPIGAETLLRPVASMTKSTDS